MSMVQTAYYTFTGKRGYPVNHILKQGLKQGSFCRLPEWSRDRMRPLLMKA
jgi:hypothetical protein